MFPIDPERPPCRCKKPPKVNRELWEEAKRATDSGTSYGKMVGEAYAKAHIKKTIVPPGYMSANERAKSKKRTRKKKG